MSFMRLLAAGKSLIVGKNEVSPYKFAKQNWLPKFGNSKDSADPTGPSLIDDRIPEVPALSGNAKADGNAAASPPVLPFPKPTPLTATAGQSRADGTTNPFHPTAPSPGNRSSILQGLFKAKTSARASRPLIQPELAFECVKVVRNDLSDADVEVVRTKGGARKAPEAVIKRSPNRETKATIGWAQITARLFAANRPRG